MNIKIYPITLLIFLILTSCADIPSPSSKDKITGGEGSIRKSQTEKNETSSNTTKTEYKYRFSDDVIKDCILPIEHYMLGVNHFLRAIKPSWW